MKYVWWGIGAYLVLGIVLTRFILTKRAPSIRRQIRDYLVGAMAMPILFLLLIFFDISEEVWARILIILDFDPPEIMRAKPKPPSGGPRKS